MSLPTPFEAVSLAQSSKAFDNWKIHNAGSPEIHSSTPDKNSFKAGWLSAVIELLGIDLTGNATRKVVPIEEEKTFWRDRYDEVIKLRESHTTVWYALKEAANSFRALLAKYEKREAGASYEDVKLWEQKAQKVLEGENPLKFFV